MIALKNVSVAYSDSTPIDRLTHTFGSGAAAVMGPSGSGKSTLLRVIAGLQAPTSGEVTLDRTPLEAPSWHSAGDPRVTLIHQDYRLVPFLTLADNLRLAAEMRRIVVDDDAIQDALVRVGLDGLGSRRMPGTLSGGEQQRAAIARSIIIGARVLLADEPTGALDVDNSVRVAQVLLEISEQEGMCVVVATHDPEVADRVGRVHLLRNGRLTKDDHLGAA